MIRPAALVAVFVLLMPAAARAADPAAGQAAFDGFSHSAAMKNSGIVWDDDSMAKYLRDPRGSMPGNKMAFPGIKNDEELANLLAYLHQATQ
jgi:cytochrome c2